MTYSEVEFEGRGKRKRKTPTRYEGTIEVVVVETGAVEMEKRGQDIEDATMSGFKRVRRSTNNMTSEVEKQEAEKSKIEQDEVKSVKSRG